MKVYLKENNNWKEFEEASEKELLDRNITLIPGTKIGDGVRIGNGVKIGNRLGKRTKWGEKYDRIHIGDDVFLGNNTEIGNGVRIADGVRIGHGVDLHYGVEIGRNTRIGDNTTIKTFSMIGVYTEIGDNVVIESHTSIGDGALVNPKAWITRTPVYINNTPDPVCQCDEHYTLKIGPEIHPLKYWENNVESIFSKKPDDIEDYKRAIEFARKTRNSRVASWLLDEY